MYFKGLQSRLVSIYLLIVIAIVMVIGVFLLYSIEDVFYKYFEDFVVENFKNEKKINFREIFDEDELKKRAKTDISSIMGIYGSYRELFILNKDLQVIYPEPRQDPRQGLPLQFTSNLVKAINGEEGTTQNSFFEEYFDFASRIVIQNGNSYIVYVRFSKDEWKGAMDVVKLALAVSALVATVVCFFLGYVLSRTITVPLSSLSSKVKRIARGDFEVIVQPRSRDEIGQLTESFNYMAGELKKNLNEISSEKNKIETILQYMTDGVIAFDLNGQVIRINHAASQLFKVKDEKKTFTDFFDRLSEKISIEEILYLDHWTKVERKLQIGNTILEILFAPFTDETNNISGIIAVIHDITEMQKLEDMRKEFVANVSHELKTPLTSIRSYSETLLDEGAQDAELTKSFLQVIHSEALRMQRLVMDLLQLSRLDHKNTKWNLQKLQIDTVVRDAIAKLKLESDVKHQVLEYHKIGEIPGILADKDGIEQIISNILSNAIKYTQEKGTISVYTGVMNSSVYIKVADNGIGIPEEDLSRIFERFYRVDKARSREMGGTGLGLSIAKEIVDAHGGEILVHSKLGEGTEVIIKFPAIAQAS